MRAQIEAGLAAAAAAGLIPAATIEHVADHVLDALAATPCAPEHPVELLPAATPVVVLTPADVVASIAASTARTAADYDETIATRIDPARPGSHESRWLAWRIMPLFGVHAMTEGTGDGTGSYKSAGRPSELAGWRSALDVLLDSGQAEADRLPADQAASFWRTMGTLVRDSDRGRALLAAAADRTAAAKTACYAEFGAASQPPAPPIAAEGTTVAAAAHRALASAALA